jgi:prophage antirepressor-like protein
MADLEIFHFNGAQVRTLTRDGEPWFVAADVARLLGYSDVHAAARRNVDPEDKGVVTVTTPGGFQNMTAVSESGLYALIFGSKLPAARDFKRWVTAEVLPAIRRTGGYVRPDASAEQLAEIKEMVATAIGN